MSSIIDNRPVSLADIDLLINPVYLYYRLYTQDGAMKSKRPANADDPYVGCIDAHHVAPPHTSGSIIRCIAKAEGIKDYDRAELFQSISSEVSMKKDQYADILKGTEAGSSQEAPLAFVQSDPRPKE